MRKISVLLIGFSWVFSSVATAKVNLAEVEHWNNIGNQYQTYSYFGDVSDKLVAEKGDNAVIWQDAGTSCPAGSFYLVNKRLKTYKEIDSGTCDDRNFAIKLENNTVTFTSEGKVTAVYPVY
ncbi:hypothetical protein [Serratia sp. DD3]|uniref:hypothetical protein n=1 Tax=Serratia sp. DD3 TaxID=1410619 RepID=UPI0003C5057A|nr:hypothetical protein [Serratia sp. DD3]KEY59861.1 hypothetical protein SRDD_12000 [Serratia sp. DD3]KEY60203.1 hypothetical protein SRDD_08320 [Serratia sp. DD3]